MDYAQLSTLIDNNLPDGSQIKSVKHREVEHALLDYIQANLAQSGDIKRIKCDLSYYTANFETNGLGKNLRLGWAQCNGNNGTDDLTGRVGIGYGLGYSIFGAIGGEKEHVLTTSEMPSHNHVISNQSNSDTGSGRVAVGGQTGEGINPVTDNIGGGLAHNNMPPYIVNLYIMKL